MILLVVILGAPLLLGALCTVIAWLMTMGVRYERRVLIALGSGLILPVAFCWVMVASVLASGGDSDVWGAAIFYLLISFFVVAAAWFATSTLVTDRD